MADDLLSLFNFEVQITPSGLGGDDGITQTAAFSEVTGLETNIEVTAIREGGYNEGARRLVGKTTNPDLVLKRGVSLDTGFWDWIQRCFDGTYPLPYVNGSIFQYSPSQDRSDDPPAEWQFSNGIVTKVKSADLNGAGGTNVPIEEVHIVHEGLVRVS
jgi:phage tail-like protein